MWGKGGEEGRGILVRIEGGSRRGDVASPTGPFVEGESGTGNKGPGHGGTWVSQKEPQCEYNLERKKRQRGPRGRRKNRKRGALREGLDEGRVVKERGNREAGGPRGLSVAVGRILQGRVKARESGGKEKTRVCVTPQLNRTQTEPEGSQRNFGIRVSSRRGH